MESGGDRLMTSRQAADFMGVTAETLRVWVREGRVSVVETVGGRRFWVGELERVKGGGLGDMSEL